jgi:hypothetical protein
MTFSLTRTVPHTSPPSRDSITTRTHAAAGRRVAKPEPSGQTFGRAAFGPQGVEPDLIPTAEHRRKPFSNSN